MKQLLLLIAGLLAVINVFAQTPSPITGSTSVCVGSSVVLNDATAGGTWTSHNSAIATIGGTSGTLTGVAAGTVVITYTVGTAYVTTRVTVNPLPAAITGASSVCIGGTLPVTLSDATPGGTWSSVNPFIVSVGSATGALTGVSPGTVNIKYTLPTGCAAVTTVTANSLAISGASVICVGGSSITLSDATSGGIWTSSNPAVATVGGSSGVVAPVTNGSTFISYTLSPGCVATTSISVKSLPSISPSSLAGCVGSTYQLTGSPAGGGWTSSNPAIAAVNYLGVVTGIAAGTTTINYNAAGGCSVSIPVTINPLPAPITATTGYVFSGLTTTLGDLTPAGTWSSGNPSLATVNPATGVVTGVAAGLVFMSYTLPTGCSAYYRVEVNPLPGTSNIYAWYPFCADSSDHSGNGRDLINHGLTTAPATLTQDRFLSANSAYHFNGVNSMMSYSTFFPNIGTPPDFTYSCWIKPGGAPQSSIIMYNGNPNADGFGFVMNSGVMGIPGSQVGVYFGASGILYASQPLPATSINGWHNLVLVKSGGVYHFYIDDGAGVFFIETNTPVFSDVFALGLNYQSSLVGPLRDAYNGDIDDVVYITRQLTGPERLSLYNYNPDADSFSLGNDTTICTDAITLSPNPQTVGANYTWSTLAGLSYSTLDTTHTSLTVYPASGPFGNQYVLEISKAQPYGCRAFDTIMVYKAAIPVNLGSDQNVCIGDTVNLTNFFPNASFLWSTGDTSHTLHVTASGTYALTVDSIHTSGPGGIDTAICVGRDTVNITFHAVPFVTLPTAPLDCQGNPVLLYSYYDTAYTYFWNTAATTDTIAATTTGTYWVRVNDHGCIRSDTTTVTIVYDTVTFRLSPDTAICRKAIVQRSATYNPIVTYQWTPTAGISISDQATASIQPDTSAEYYLIVRYPGCPDKVDSVFIDVQPNPTVYMGGNRDVCFGDTIHITADVSPSWYTHYIYNWTPAVGLDYTTTSTVVFNTLAAAQDTSIKFIVTVTTPAYRTGVTGCYYQDSGVISIHPHHFEKLDSTRIDLCPGDSIQLIPQDTSTLGAIASAYHWSPGLYLDDSTSSKPWVHPITSQDYRLIAYSQYGCKDTMNVSIIVHPAPQITLGDSVIIYPGDSYQIVPVTNCIYFQWYPPLGLDYPNISNPVATPGVSTTYYVNASTEAGCTILDSFRIHVDPASLIGIPNAFTPGAVVNNKFYVMKKGVVALNYFRIYDRWGNMVYESKNIDEGWDGTYKGKPQPFGVYVYELEAVAPGGTVFTRRGNVTLLR